MGSEINGEAGVKRAENVDNNIKLSIIIPALNEQKNLRELLPQLQRLRYCAEIIVVDANKDISFSKEVAGYVDHYLSSDKGRARQMNLGAQSAKGWYLLFLHADTRLPEQLDDVINYWISGGEEWGFFKVKLFPKTALLTVVNVLMNVRSTCSKIATGDQAIWVQAKLFHQLGGYLDIPLMEDIALSKMLKTKSDPVVLFNRVSTSSRRWLKRGVVKTVLLMWALRLGYFFRVDTKILAKFYR